MSRAAMRALALMLLSAGWLWSAGCSQDASSSVADGRAAPSVAIGTVVGMRAPTLDLPALKGGLVRLDELRGKVVLVNFWATWCGPCLMEMPSMERLYREFADEEFEILAISSDFEGAAVVKPYVDRLRLTFPILLDFGLQINDRYKVTGIPTSVIVDRDGVITHKFFGSRDWDSPDSHRLIRQLLRARA
jgi:peroxiredoxin